MIAKREIVKVGLAVTEANCLLLVRKRGGGSYILPGGKPEVGENDRQVLAREIYEELGCSVDFTTAIFLGEFTDKAADMLDTFVTVRLYAAQLLGSPAPKSEIESLAWYRPGVGSEVALAPSLQNKIVPFLCAHGRLVSDTLKHEKLR